MESQDTLIGCLGGGRPVSPETVRVTVESQDTLI